MIGHHVNKYPQIARQVATQGHLIGNHGYAHSVVLYYTDEEIEEEIKYTEHIIKEVTGQVTKFYRPPKAWITPWSKDKIKSIGYEVVLWSINPKDWVSFPSRFMVNVILNRVRPGEIILFHDSGNIFSTEGGRRAQTVKAIGELIPRLKERGFECVTVEELIDEKF